jgi:hypothetical protein
VSWYKNRKNKKFAKKLGWTPEMFEETKFDRSLELAITYFQKQYPEFLEVDGICGPATYRFLLNDLNRNGLVDTVETLNRHSQAEEGDNPGGTCLLVNGKWVDIGWPTVWRPLPSKNFKKQKKLRPISCAVVHHDATTSAKVCFRVLKKGGISTHLCIDNDGVIYQFADLNDITWHAGVSYWRKRKGEPRRKFRSRKLNNVSIGIDFSNAWYVKYNQDFYKPKGYGARRVIKESEIHGVDVGEHLDMYPVQLEAFEVLVDFLHKEFDIPLEIPRKDELFNRGWDKECMKGNFKGFQVHFNSSVNKIDTDIDMLRHIDNVKGRQ